MLSYGFAGIDYHFFPVSLHFAIHHCRNHGKSPAKHLSTDRIASHARGEYLHKANAAFQPRIRLPGRAYLRFGRGA